MTPAEKHDAASAALRAHELEHLKIQRQYEASYYKLKTLSRAASDAWSEMMNPPQSRSAGQPPPK